LIVAEQFVGGAHGTLGIVSRHAVRDGDAVLAWLGHRVTVTVASDAPVGAGSGAAGRG